MPDPQRGAVGWLAAMTLLAVSFGTVVGGARLAVETPVPVIETTSVFPSGPANPVFGTDTSRDDASPSPAIVDSEAQRAAPTVPVVETR